MRLMHHGAASMRTMQGKATPLVTCSRKAMQMKALLMMSTVRHDAVSHLLLNVGVHAVHTLNMYPGAASMCTCRYWPAPCRARQRRWWHAAAKRCR